MKDTEFASYIKNVISLYAQDIAQSRGTSVSNQLFCFSQERINKILPRGIDTDSHYFYLIFNDGVRIGSVWYSVHDSLVILYDIFLYKAHRRKGYGSETLKKIESSTRKQGSRSLMLHVFFHNKHAQKFYEKNGYITTGFQMLKQLSH